METEQLGNDIAEVTSMETTQVTVRCPHCDEMQSGFLGNPAGHTFECDHCQLPYKIHPEADIEFL